MAESLVYPPRVQKFREAIIAEVPRVPNDRSSLAVVQAMPTSRLILALLTWRHRFVPPKVRRVGLWSGGISPAECKAKKDVLGPFFEKVMRGADLTPHLSNLVQTRGLVLPGAHRSTFRDDIDAVLIRDGLHHFHLGEAKPGNLTGRSGTLLFAEVLEEEFRVVAVAGHKVFKPQSPERLKFLGICRSYIAREIPAGQAFMQNPVMSSGHSLWVTMFADHCAREIERLEPLLDDQKFISRIYQGQDVVCPDRPALKWHFEDLQFGWLEEQTGVFFCLSPFFKR